MVRFPRDNGNKKDRTDKTKYGAKERKDMLLRM